MAEKTPYVDKSLLEFIERNLAHFDFNIEGDAEEQMRSLAYRQGQIDLLAKLSTLERKGRR